MSSLPVKHEITWLPDRKDLEWANDSTVWKRTRKNGSLFNRNE